MLYPLLKIWVTLAAKIFCRRIIINVPERLKMDGPLLLAANHPNSFLDAILLDILFKNPVWSLARGDAFKNPFYKKVLTKLKILPVYRTSEGVENLEINYTTFAACKEIFRNKGIVLMFSEGKCINEWHLRPLKKGTARLAISSWQDEIPVTVLPVGINYSSFRKFGKNIFLNFGNLISKADISISETDGKKHQTFNNRLLEELQPLVFEIPQTDKLLREKWLVVKPSVFSKMVFVLPAFLGYIFHVFFYLAIRYFVRTKTRDSDHYDSVLLALLIFLYPFYLLLIAFLMFWFTCSWMSLGVLLLLPFTAWAYVQVKEQLDT
ncbi:MAG: 1-acyl-sn-glycerol-3-phosphate acyltransferase [Chitinophagaceae bacterium]|nr:1-acyl-sn-glycerol-3-phosphate acyltransferase [Chitinophagaceae bacterium]